jgi:hypothetical protein
MNWKGFGRYEVRSPYSLEGTEEKPQNTSVGTASVSAKTGSKNLSNISTVLFVQQTVRGFIL